ncbi:MAG: prenyltransferase [Proteobacteria bacterium]|nr:prenyltransferase [Pseudomonadota bacterium]
MSAATQAGGLSHSLSVKARMWWVAVRPFSFPVSLVPAVLGVAFAWTRGFEIDPLLAFLTAFGAVAAHAGANLLQDYFDFTSGIDGPGKQGGSGMLVSGTLSPREIFAASVVAFAMASLVSVPLILRAGSALLWIVLAGFALAAGYAVPSRGLKHYALGDIAVFLAFGAGVTLGSYLVQAGSFSFAPLACGAPFGMLVVAVLLANNIRDAREDARAGVRTLAVFIGGRAARALYIALVLAAFAMPALFAALRLVNAGALLSLAAFPSAYGAMRDVWRAPDDSSTETAHADERTAKIALIYGALMAIGMVAWKLLEGGV